MAGRTSEQRGFASGWFWLLALLFSLAAWWFASRGSRDRLVLIAALALASFAVGSIVGFLFTSYGEESSTIGKVRDWLLAGVTGLSFSQVIDKDSALKRTLASFVVGNGQNEYGLVIGVAVVYVALGFFFMFLQRELILNLLLARTRAERGRMEGTQQAGIVMQRFLLTLPASILSGVDDVDEIVQFKKGEAEKLRELLYSEDVQAFIGKADEAARTGVSLDWDVVSKVANLQYYRTYFEKDDKKHAQAETAYSWISRALIINPLHVDLTVKCADLLGIMAREDEAVAILERLERTPEAPAYVKQWLGYFLLNIEGRLDDAIRFSEDYHKLFPTESDSVFNIAYAYAQKYADELRQNGKPIDLQSNNRKIALTKLREALRQQPEYLETVRDSWTKAKEAFACFIQDEEFCQIVGLPSGSQLVAHSSPPLA